MATANSTTDSSTRGTWKAEGNASESERRGDCTITVTETWSGSDLFSGSNFAHVVGLHNGIIAGPSRTMKLGVHGAGARYCASHLSTGCAGSGAVEASPFFIVDGSVAGNPVGILTFRFDSRWNAAPGGTGWKQKKSEVSLLGQKPEIAQHSLSWPEGLQCTAPPPLNQRVHQGSERAVSTTKATPCKYLGRGCRHLQIGLRSAVFVGVCPELAPKLLIKNGVGV